MGGAPSTPSNTTSTTTVNQSPWQNPTYQALALGSSSSPGPVTSLIKNAGMQQQLYNEINQGNIAELYGMPSMTQDQVQAAKASQGTWNPAVGTGSTFINAFDPTSGRYVAQLNPNASYAAANLNQTAATNAINNAANQVAAPAAPVQAAQGGIMSLDPRKSRGK